MKNKKESEHWLIQNEETERVWTLADSSEKQEKEEGAAAVNE